MAQFKKRKSTGLDQTQGLFILASFVEPKLTVGAWMVFQVFDCRVAWSQVDFPLVVDSLARIFDSQPKVFDVVGETIC